MKCAQNMAKKVTHILFTLALFYGCSLDNDYVRQRTWKYGAGYWLSHDFITFGGGYLKLTNDTIYMLDSAVAVVYETEKGYFGNDNEIHIKSISTNKTGIYHDFGIAKASDTAVEIILTLPTDTDEPPVPPAPKKSEQ